jgi:hypothetical protein
MALTDRSTAFGKESKTKSYVKIGPAPGDYSLKSDLIQIIKKDILLEIRKEEL